jgi:hypothetical protein
VSLAEVQHLLRATNLAAIAIPPDQRWSILPEEYVPLVPKLQGGSTAWIGRKGITTDLNGVYFVELLGLGASPGVVRIRTTPYSGRKTIPFIDRDVEAELVYPLLKSGEQIRRFSYSPIDLVAIVPNKVITSITPVENFRREYPATYGYFTRINRETSVEGTPLLEDRSTWRTRMASMGAPFYAIYNVGAYTFSPYKVVWAEMAGSVAAAVVGAQDLAYGLGTKPVVPDHKVYFVACDTEDEAHFLCAMVNSEPVRLFVDSFTVKIQVGTLFKQLKLPGYDPNESVHRALSELSKEAHLLGITDERQQKIDNYGWEVVRRM